MGSIVKVGINLAEEEGDDVVEVLGGGTGENLGGDGGIIPVLHQKVEEGADGGVHEALVREGALESGVGKWYWVRGASNKG